MKKWFNTLKEAKREKEQREKKGENGLRIFKGSRTKRKKPFFVGTFLDWIEN